MNLEYVDMVSGSLVHDFRIFCSSRSAVFDDDEISNNTKLSKIFSYMIKHCHIETVMRIIKLEDNVLHDKYMYQGYYFECKIDKKENLLIIQNKLNPSISDGSAFLVDGTTFKKGYPEVVGIKDLDSLLENEKEHKVLIKKLRKMSIAGNFIEKICSKILLNQELHKDSK